MSIEHDITDEMVARIAGTLGLGPAPDAPVCEYEVIAGRDPDWHVMRVRGSGFEQRRELVRIVPNRADAENMVRMLKKRRPQVQG